jgi:hypothetical protein
MLMMCYHFNEDLTTAVDLEVIKPRSKFVTLETEGTHDTFRAKLLERDIRCVWTDTRYGSGIHIIPFERGSEVCSTVFFCWGDT